MKIKKSKKKVLKKKIKSKKGGSCFGFNCIPSKNNENNENNENDENDENDEKIIKKQDEGYAPKSLFLYSRNILEIADEIDYLLDDIGIINKDEPGPGIVVINSNNFKLVNDYNDKIKEENRKKRPNLLRKNFFLTKYNIHHNFDETINNYIKKKFELFSIKYQNINFIDKFLKEWVKSICLVIFPEDWIEKKESETDIKWGERLITTIKICFNPENQSKFKTLLDVELKGINDYKNCRDLFEILPSIGFNVGILNFEKFYNEYDLEEIYKLFMMIMLSDNIKNNINFTNCRTCITSEHGKLRDKNNSNMDLIQLLDKKYPKTIKSKIPENSEIFNSSDTKSISVTYYANNINKLIDLGTPYYDIILDNKIDIKEGSYLFLVTIITNQKNESSFHLSLIQTQMDEWGSKHYCLINKMINDNIEGNNINFVAAGELEISKELEKVKILYNFYSGTVMISSYVFSLDYIIGMKLSGISINDGSGLKPVNNNWEDNNFNNPVYEKFWRPFMENFIFKRTINHNSIIYQDKPFESINKYSMKDANSYLTKEGEIFLNKLDKHGAEIKKFKNDKWKELYQN